MSDERFDRIENQLNQVLQAITTLDTHVAGVKNRLTSVEQNQNAAREDITALRNRIEAIGDITKVAITDGFQSLDLYLDDLNADLAMIERVTRRTIRRVDRLERRYGY